MCKNNLRQLQIGWRAYAEANDDKLVRNLTTSTILYDLERRESLYGSWVLGNAQTDTTTENIQKGLLIAHTFPRGFIAVRPTGQPSPVIRESVARAATR